MYNNRILIRRDFLFNDIDIDIQILIENSLPDHSFPDVMDCVVYFQRFHNVSSCGDYPSFLKCTMVNKDAF